MQDARVEMDAKSRPGKQVMFDNLGNYGISRDMNLAMRSTLRSKIQLELCNKKDAGCDNPLLLDVAVSSGSEYKDLVAKDDHCVSVLENGFRKRILVKLPECR